MSLTNIGSAIDKNNPKAFVDAYLLCVAQGFSIHCPVDKKIQDLNKKWSKILAKYRRDFTDEFCNEVSKIWFNLLEQCKTEAPNIELQLCNAAGISLEAVTKATETEKKKTSLSDIPEKVSSDEGLTSAISERYRERQQAESISLPELTRLESVRKKAFLSKDSAAFLIAHLTFAKHGQFQESHSRHLSVRHHARARPAPFLSLLSRATRRFLGQHRQP